MKKIHTKLALFTLVIGMISSGCQAERRLEGKYAYDFLGAKTTSLRFTKDGTVYLGTFATAEQKGTYTMSENGVEVTFNINGSTFTQKLSYNESADSLTDPDNKIYKREN